MLHRRFGLVLALGATAVCFSVAAETPPPSGARAAGSAAVAAGSAAPLLAPPPSPEVAARLTRSQRVVALREGALDTTIDAAVLFDVPLADEDGIRVEIERLRAVLAHAAGPAAAPSASGAAKVPAAPPRKSGKTPASAPSAEADAGAEPGTGALEAELDEALWRAQLALDGAHLAFYELPRVERDAKLAAHAGRQRADKEAAAERELSAVERTMGEAELEQLRALADAKLARTEAARLVGEEHARLLGVKREQARFEADLISRETALGARQERALGLRRQVREVIEARRTGGTVEAADRLYDEVRATLRPARDALAESTRELARSESDVPGAGEDRLVDLPMDVDRTDATAERGRVVAASARLTQREHQFRALRARQLSDEVVALNGDRLSLLGHVSPRKRDAVTGLGATGLDQAAAEVRQVNVILGYHLIAATDWVSEMRAPGGSRGTSALVGLFIALKWLVPVALFVWWRRRAERVLASLLDALRTEYRKTLRRSVEPSLGERAVEFAVRVRSPLEWLLLFWAVLATLPIEAQALLEVQLVRTALIWTLAGAIAVQVVDFFAGAESDRRARRSSLQTAHIRLKSLRLVSYVVVGFGVLLAMTTQLVGQGTIYGWVWSVCWFAAVPVVLVLVRWWRSIIFALVGSRRKPTRLEGWVVGNRDGWASFPAAFLAGSLLLGRGVYRAVVTRISKLTVARRILAYLFSREIGKKAEQDARVAYAPLPPDTFAALGPETASQALVPGAADEGIARVLAQIHASGGGVFALVGERGMGKTRLLRQIGDTVEHAQSIQCPFGGMEAFSGAFLEARGAAPDAKLEAVAAELDSLGRDPAVLIDDAHRLILPRMGGLRAFDRLLAIARTSSHNTCWIFAFDQVIWRFFERMRGARPLFDDVMHLEPWAEEDVARLLEARVGSASLTPDFSALLPELAVDADEVDVAEALERTEASYYRLIWDYAGGNPGVALHTFRKSLGVMPNGTVSVKVFQPPKTADLERLPDSAVFTLRALVQLEHASIADLCAATSIGQSQVADAVRFGLVKGYLERASNGDVFVSWTWFRPITRLLARRHLLFEG